MFRPGTLALTALLASLTSIGPLSTDMYLPSLPDIARLLDATTGQVQLTLSSYLIGFAVGQVLYGPVSDRYGRKSVLLAAIGIYLLATVLCSLAVSIEMLIAARFIQAFGGSGAVVVARAVVRDLYSGSRAARELSLMGAIQAIAPIVAPLLGGMTQTVAGWRATFLILTAFALAQLLLIWRMLPETLPSGAAATSIGSVIRGFGSFSREGAFLAYLGLIAASYAGLFAWLSGASFVLQDLYGLSAVVFALVFTVGSIGYLVGTGLAAALVMRLGLDGTIGIGSVALFLGGLTMVATQALGASSAAALVVPVAIYLAGLGMVMPQSIAGALQPFPHRAGTASSFIGVVQQGLAAVAGALVGHLLGTTPWPMVIAIALAGAACLLIWSSTRAIRRSASAQRP